MKSNLMGFLLLSLCFAISCTSTKTTTPNLSTLDKEKILVLLKPGVKARALAKEFASYSLKSKGQTSRSENRFIFSYDTTSVSADELLEKIKSSSNVVEAVFPEITKEPRVSN